MANYKAEEATTKYFNINKMKAKTQARKYLRRKINFVGPHQARSFEELHIIRNCPTCYKRLQNSKSEMALVDLDSWSTEFESCKRLGTTLLSQLNQREKKKHVSSEQNRYTSAIQVGLKQYDRELEQLKFKLTEASKNKTISLEEIGGRQQELDALQSQRLQLQSKYNNSAANDRNALMQNSSPSNMNFEEDSDAAPIIDTNDVQALKQHQIDMLEQQNRGLETLSQTLSRQKHLATQLGQEVEEQNDILDNLANTIERVEAGVSQETRNVGSINRRDSTWGYWVVIIILMIAILIVAVL